MNISKTAKSLTHSTTLKLNEKAAILHQKGESIIHLGGGEPLSDPPSAAISAIQDLLKSRTIHYAPAGGTRKLKQAIVKYTSKYYQKDICEENVIATVGAKQALFLTLQSIINIGDEVVFPAPYWVSYPEMVKICGGIPKTVIPKADIFHPTIEDIQKIVTKKTKAIILNSPNNPSGSLYSDDFIADVIAVCEKNNLYLIMDDIYQRLVFDGKTAVSSLKLVTESIENCKLIVVNGVSKQYAMTGFRLGWAIGNSKIIKIMAKLQAHQTTAPSLLADTAATAALIGNQSDVENLRASLENKRNILISSLNEINGVKPFNSEGTYYCFADFRKYSGNSAKLSEFLVEKAKVITVPGIAFGVDGYLRISFCRSVAEIKEGVERIKHALLNNYTQNLI